MIKCKNVYKTFGDKKVLNGIDFEIPDGQIFGLLGPSGAGKTTLIKILTDQLSFDSGEIEILNKNVHKLTGDDKKKIGIMMDQFGVYERLSCSDNLKIFADIYGISHRRVKEILKYVGLEDAEKRSASNLSKIKKAFGGKVMEDNKTIFNYLGQLFATYGIIVTIFVVFTILIGEM